MKKVLLVTILLITQIFVAQDKGTVKGLLTDKESNNDPLPFANVFIKGTTIGVSTDFDGNYSIKIPVGEHIIVFSFIGYETVEKPIIIKAGESITINQGLGANQGVTLDEIQIKATVSREKETALLLEQKKAVSIKTTIGAQELAKKGVSDVAAAVTKATGISKQEGSNNVYVRGLGDRYNSTTLNGLPLPSNNPSTKNISLDIFSTDIVQVIDINKIYNNKIYGDFGGANINIASKEHTGKPSLYIKIGSGVNSNSVNESNFYLQDGPSFSGFYNTEIPNNVLNGYNFFTSWDRITKSPINTNIAVKGGKKYEIGEKSSLSLFGTISFSNGFKFKEGITRGSVNAQGLAYIDLTFKAYDYNTNTTGMLNLTYKANDRNTYKFSSLFVNSSNQSLDDYNGIINVFDNATTGGGFIRRSTFDRTSLFVNQFLGEHKITDKINAEWGIAYNKVNNVVPDRRQNMLVPTDENNPNGTKIVSDLAASDNHRFFQELKEDEIALNTAINYNFSENEDEKYDGKITIGYSARIKQVDFKATQFNFRINRNIAQPTIDVNNLDAYFNQNSINSNLFNIETFRGDASTANALDPQTYKGIQFISAGFADVQYKFNEKFTATIGTRFEQVYQKIEWKTSLDPNGDDNAFVKIEVLPNMALKYALTEKQNLKVAASKSYTLPQYKERAPFQFEEVTQIKFGNPDLNLSTNYNFDARWEMFPKSGEVISLTGFGKVIQNPINEVIVASATNDISYVNTGKQATVFGAEFEIRKEIINLENEESEGNLENKLTVGFNASYMNSNQDFDPLKIIKETKLNVNFTNKEGRLTGASDLLLNADASYFKEFSKDKNLQATISYNYFSDRVYALGSANKGNLVDNAVHTLDLIVKSKLTNKINIGLSVKNLLNPTIKRTQEAQNIEVLSFKKGINASFSITYKL